jgi:hypothetical protein
LLGKVIPIRKIFKSSVFRGYCNELIGKRQNLPDPFHSIHRIQTMFTNSGPKESVSWYFFWTLDHMGTTGEEGVQQGK